ncbi:type II secretion system protein [Clostridium cuniculi]|uniref:type II secretion system protein n=1 Tax=Clostridium cuniculi TaxID=2548455 RepID=UPI0018ABBB14|nr:type II secretion system protein [Clostridium cuniculi]
MKLKSKTIKSKKKKKGFTLIELVAVLAIIAILSAAFVPKVGNYITEAKKVAVLNEAKTVVTAYESIRHKSGFNTNSIGSDFEGTNLPLESGTLKKLGSATVKQCTQIIDTENNTFTFSDDGTSIIINDDESNSITLD